MELIVEASDLYRAVTIASKFTSVINTISNNILFTAGDGCLELLSTDIEQVCSVRIPGTVKNPGSILVPSKQAKAFSINVEGPVTLSMKRKLEFKYATHTFRADTTDEDHDFFPEHTVLGDGFVVGSGVFEPARGTIHIGGRRQLECVYLMPGPDSHVISADGFVASMVFADFPVEEPTPILGDLFSKALSAIPGDQVLITISGTRVRVSDLGGDIAISFPLAIGINIPEWDVVFGAEVDATAELPEQTVRGIYTIFSRTMEADDGAFATIDAKDGELRVSVKGYAESDGLPVDGEVIQFSNYSKSIVRVLKYIDQGKPLVLETIRFEDSDIARAVYIKQDNMVFFVTGAKP